MRLNIGKFSKLSGFSIDTLRYYEKEGLIIPDRDENNRRVFTEKDITWIDFIKKLKMTGMRLKDIKLYAQLRYQGEDTIQERLELLFEQSQILLERQKEVEEHISFLKQKITVYEKMILDKNRLIKEEISA